MNYACLYILSGVKRQTVSFAHFWFSR